MGNVLVVGLGGFVGAILRYALSGWVNGHVRAFPLGTLVVNALGCLLIGVLMGAVDAGRELSDAWRFFLAMGLLGAFTTFSTFGYEAIELIRAERLGAAVLSVGANVAVGLVAVVIGRALAG